MADFILLNKQQLAFAICEIVQLGLLSMPKFILHTDKEGVRTVGAVILESEKRYQCWFGGTINRKPSAVWISKSECKVIPEKDIWVANT